MLRTVFACLVAIVSLTAILAVAAWGAPGSISLKPGTYHLDPDSGEPGDIEVADDQFDDHWEGVTHYWDEGTNGYTALHSGGGAIHKTVFHFFPAVWPFPGTYTFTILVLTPSGWDLVGVVSGTWHKTS